MSFNQLPFSVHITFHPAKSLFSLLTLHKQFISVKNQSLLKIQASDSCRVPIGDSA